jgi:hypothetical protein
MSRDRNRRWDIPSIIRVQDKNNVLTSSADLGRAVGWAKIQVRALNRLLRGPDNKKKLPHRTFHYAMPVSKVSRISIWTNPPDGSWFVRIIGGGGVAGNFIWTPADFENPWPVGTELQRTFSDGNKALIIDGYSGGRSSGSTKLHSQGGILVKAEGFGGPYEAVLKNLEAGNIDWKGPERTTKTDGSPLPEPITDVLTFIGPENRYGPSVRRQRSHTHFVWKNGEKYARAPLSPFGRGTDDPANDPGEDNDQLNRLKGVVLGAAIQEGTNPDTGLRERRDILITDTMSNTGTRSNPAPLELWDVEWHVWWRPADSGMTTNETWSAGFPPFFVGGDPPGSPKWRLIASFPGPTDFNGARYVRHRTWFFNRSATQACCMVPGNQVGDYIPAPSSFPSTGTNPGWNLQQVAAGGFPNYMRQAVLTVDAFAEATSTGKDAGTASIVIGDRSAPGLVKTRIVQPSNCTAGGSSEQGCPPEPTFRDFPDPTGSSSMSRSQSSSTTYAGGKKWQVACDYKGDTLVPAFIEFNGAGLGGASNIQITQSVLQNGTGSFFSSQTEDIKYTLTFGSVNEIVGQRARTVNRSDSGANESFIRTGLDNNNDGLGGGVSPLYLDIRNDLLLLSITVKQTRTQQSGDGTLANANHLTNLFVGHGLYSVRYGSHGGTNEFISSLRLIQGGSVLTEWTWESSESINGTPNLFGIFGTGFFVDTELAGAGGALDSCPPGGESTLFRTDEIRDPFCIQPGISDGSTLVTQINGPPGLETFGLNPQAGLTPFQTTQNPGNSWLANTVGVDTAGNIAMSVATMELAPWFDEQRGNTLRERVNWTRNRVPRTQPYLNYLSGDDIVVVSNQLVYIDPGLDRRDDDGGTPADDVTLPPVATVSGHAYPVVGPVLPAETDIGLGSQVVGSIRVL